MEYFQPEFYRFSEDSIHLANTVATFLKEGQEQQEQSQCGLDLCAGSGVVGIEIMLKTMNHQLQLDFCELQREFSPYIHANLKSFFQVGYSYKPKITFCSFEKLRVKKFHEKYDIIASNPPYFDPKRSRLSPHNPHKNLCRFLIEGEWVGFFKTIFYCLKNEGKAYFVHRNDLQKDLNWENSLKEIHPNLEKGSNFSLKKIKTFDKISIFEFSKTMAS